MFSFENPASVVTVAGICNSVGGGVLFDTPPRCQWQISVQYASCTAGAGQSSIQFPSPHVSSRRTHQPLPPLLIIRRLHDAIIAAVGRATNRSDYHVVHQRISQLIALVVLGTKYLAANPL